MRIAGVQAAPRYLDRKGTIEKAVASMQDAADGGADLVAFPETFVAGYPAWVDLTDGAAWNDIRQKSAFADYLDSAVDIDGDEFGLVVTAARDLGLFTYIGVVERAASAGSVYCSLVAIDPTAGVVGVHRKLKPTFGERLVWADGDGHGLRVHEHRGWRVSGLNCWENWMPLARSTLYAQGTQLHIATWPGSPRLTRDITRFIAEEGRVYVLSVGGVLRAEHIPDGFVLKEAMLAHGDRYCSGGTMLTAPDGSVVDGPIKDDETILFADLDLELVRRERQNFDPTGHYSRPDVFGLHVDRSRRTTTDFVE